MIRFFSQSVKGLRGTKKIWSTTGTSREILGTANRSRENRWLGEKYRPQTHTEKRLLARAEQGRELERQKHPALLTAWFLTSPSPNLSLLSLRKGRMAA